MVIDDQGLLMQLYHEIIRVEDPFKEIMFRVCSSIKLRFVYCAVCILTHNQENMSTSCAYFHWNCGAALYVRVAAKQFVMCTYKKTTTPNNTDNFYVFICLQGIVIISLFKRKRITLFKTGVFFYKVRCLEDSLPKTRSPHILTDLPARFSIMYELPEN